MKDFVKQDSIVRRIWGDGDMILFIFGGSAAEFALNRAVDWLFFTNKLPSDPIGRLFSTAGYARHIVFADERTATGTLEGIRHIHAAVERKRGQAIPDWAHRDVLYMLIDYSERAHQMLVRRLTTDEQRDLYDVFRRVGLGLRIPDLPATYPEWRADRERHLARDLIRSVGSAELQARYREHLGPWRYYLLRRIQSIMVPPRVLRLMQLKRSSWMLPLVRLYPLLARLGMRALIQRALIPAAHLAAVRALDGNQRSVPVHADSAAA